MLCAAFNISVTYHAWRGKAGGYADEPGFCKAATTAEIAASGYVLTPGRYVGAAAIEADAEPLDAKMRSRCGACSACGAASRAWGCAWTSAWHFWRRSGRSLRRAKRREGEPEPRDTL